MRKTFLTILLMIMAMAIAASATGLSAGSDSLPARATLIDSAAFHRGSLPTAAIEDRKVFLKHIRDSINAIPFDTTRDDDYWRRCIVNGKWSFFTDPTAPKPGLLNFASKVYRFYTKAFNNYDTAYVVGIKQNWKIMLKNNDWLDSYGGTIADNDMKVFMNSNVYSNVGVHVSYLGIGYTYMVDLDNVFGGDPTMHSKWEMTFATSRFSFEAYHSRNQGDVTIGRFGDYNNKKPANVKFNRLSRVSSGFDLYYFFNHRKYSQAAAYSYSKIQKRSAGSLIAGFLVATQNVSIDFRTLPDEMRMFLPDGPQVYRYHYRSYSFLVGYAYNWVFRPKWLFNVTMAPSIGWNHSFHDSVDGKRDMLAFDLRGRLGLVRNNKYFFYGLQLLIDAHFYHSKNHNFINALEDLNLTIGVRF